jgi:hypothetical protein
LSELINTERLFNGSHPIHHAKLPCIAALTNSLDATIAAYTALEQNLDDIQPAAAVARSLTVLADDYDELCARLSQFNFWIRYSSNSAKFSQSGLIELGRFYERVQLFPANNQMSTGQQGVLGLYQSDPEVRAAEQRIAASTYSMQSLWS